MNCCQPLSLVQVSAAVSETGWGAGSFTNCECADRFGRSNGSKDTAGCGPRRSFAGDRVCGFVSTSPVKSVGEAVDRRGHN